MDVKNVFMSYDDYNEEVNEEYKGLLEIPKLFLKQPFYLVDSVLNNVDKSIYLVTGSTMPWEEYSNLILAAHSGYSEVSYFHDLDKLKIKDRAKIIIHNIQYTYQLVSIYQEEKNGNIVIHREPRKNHLTLITCDRKNKNFQNVYIFELIHKD